MSSNPEIPSSPLPDAHRPGGSEPLLPDDLLPPVEPPDARFILQLFVVPAVIVLAVVLLGWIVTSLASTGEMQPEKIVAALRRSGPNRWQQAFELANALRTEARYPELRSNRELAGQLATLLDEEVTAGNTDDNSVKLRTFLAAALGEFHVEDGLAALLRTAEEDPDTYVRGAAINAVAVLAEDFRTQDPPRTLPQEKLVESFTTLASDQHDVVRSHVAYALGVITQSPDADPQLQVELERLVDDLFPDARYNAATGLARQGSPLAIPALVEMLNLESLAVSIKTESNPALQIFKRNTILKNALEAVEQLAEQEKAPDLAPLRDALDQFLKTAPEWKSEGPVPVQLINRARDVRAQLAKAE